MGTGKPLAVKVWSESRAVSDRADRAALVKSGGVVPFNRGDVSAQQWAHLGELTPNEHFSVILDNHG